jgi:hypothetical protein
LNDWARVGDRWYVSFPPFPALLMMPFVAVFGLRFNDVLFTLLVAALNVPLFYGLLRRLAAEGESNRAPRDDLWLALFHAFGTVLFSGSIRGEVWFTAHVVGVTLTCLYLTFALRARRPALAGLVLACAAITRTPLAFAAVFFLRELWMLDASWRERLKRLGVFTAAAAAVIFPMMAMNWARFGNPLEFGHAHLFQNRVNDDIARWGLFHYHYLERNLHSAFTMLPQLELHPPRLAFDGAGMSLFITTPLFLLLLWPRERPRLHRAVWWTVAAVALPGLLYQNTGWYQFGYRFSIDWAPLLFVLLALGGRPLNRWALALGAAGVAVNAWGAVVFGR